MFGGQLPTLSFWAPCLFYIYFSALDNCRRRFHLVLSYPFYPRRGLCLMRFALFHFEQFRYFWASTPHLD